MTKSVTAGSPTCVTHFLMLAQRLLRGAEVYNQRYTITTGQPEFLGKSHSAKGQALSTSTGPLISHKLSDLCFLRGRKVQGLLYTAFLT